LVQKTLNRSLHLIDPYARAVNDIDNARLSVMQDYRALKKQLGFVPKNLRKKIPGEPYSREQAVRVYIWNKLGYEVPGISKQDLKELTARFKRVNRVCNRKR